MNQTIRNLFSQARWLIKEFWSSNGPQRGNASLVGVIGVAGVVGLSIATKQLQTKGAIDHVKRSELMTKLVESNHSAFCKAQKLYAADASGIGPIYPQPYINYSAPDSMTIAGKGGVSLGNGWKLQSSNNLEMSIPDTSVMSDSEWVNAMNGIAPNTTTNVSLLYKKKIVKNNDPFLITGAEMEASISTNGLVMKNRAQIEIPPPPDPSCSLEQPSASLYETPVNLAVNLKCKNVITAAGIEQSLPAVTHYAAPSNNIKQFNSISVDQNSETALHSQSFSSVGSYKLFAKYTGIGRGSDGKADYVTGSSNLTSFTIETPPVCQLVPSAYRVECDQKIGVQLQCDKAIAYSEIDGVAGSYREYSGSGNYTVTGKYKGLASNAKEKTTTLEIAIDQPPPPPTCELVAIPASQVTYPDQIRVEMRCTGTPLIDAPSIHQGSGPFSGYENSLWSLTIAGTARGKCGTFTWPVPIGIVILNKSRWTGDESKRPPVDHKCQTRSCVLDRLKAPGVP